MENHEEVNQHEQVVRQDRGAQNQPVRRVYKMPKLISLGDIRALTLGGSPGVGDSLVPNTLVE